MKLWVYTELQLRQLLDRALVPDHVKTFFAEMIVQNNLSMVEYISSIFNLGYLPHYTLITPRTAYEYEYDGVLQDFLKVHSQLRDTDMYHIYGIDPLDAIYQHSAYSSGYDSFGGYFYDDLYSLIETVNANEYGDYVQDISLLVRFLVESIERVFVQYQESSEPIYVTVTSKPGMLMVLVR